jgi:SpoVK/Ycf46/Vps4 family AAA+-type ATPase
MTGITAARPELSRNEIDGGPAFHGLLPAFRRLEGRLKLLVRGLDRGGFESDSSPYPGLTISKSELNHLLAREPGELAFSPDEVLFQQPLFDPLDNANPQFGWLAQEYGLSSFDLDVILIALAPELDLRYERIFAYLQDDITCKRPSVDLALNLLCPSAGARQARRGHFVTDAPLIRNNLLQLVPDADHARSKLACQLSLEDGVINLLLGRKCLDRSLTRFCQLIEPAISLADVPISAELKRALQVLVTQPQNQSPRFCFHGQRGTGKRQTAEALSAQTNTGLLVVDIEQALTSAPDFDQTLRLILREARFHHALVYFENVDVLGGMERDVSRKQLLKALDEDSGTTILAGEKPLKGLTNKFEVHFPVQDFAQRRTCWADSLQQHDIAIDTETLDVLAGSFRLPCGEIVVAVTGAIDLATLRAAGESSSETLSQQNARPTAGDLFASARARLSHNLAQFARKIEPKYEWEDIVLAPDQLAQLREICARSKYQRVVYAEWGFDRKLSLGKGLNALFSGHPGTGKTMAAEVIANELHLDLYKIDLSQVVSKYIGETEKSLNHIFREAQASSSILFFDEADALFGKRTEVKDSHDRYANIEVSYLLQKMEEYDGIAILATNLRQNMDEAFLRRMQFIVEFPFPDEEHRKSIWEIVFPPEAPVASDVDFRLLAREIRLAGGNIKSIGLAAAFYAAADGRVIRQQHLIRAARREFQKLGRNWNERDWKNEKESLPNDGIESAERDAAER